MGKLYFLFQPRYRILGFYDYFIFTLLEQYATPGLEHCIEYWEGLGELEVRG